jgi:hypothetical protein
VSESNSVALRSVQEDSYGFLPYQEAFYEALFRDAQAEWKDQFLHRESWSSATSTGRIEGRPVIQSLPRSSTLEEVFSRPKAWQWVESTSYVDDSTVVRLADGTTYVKQGRVTKEITMGAMPIFDTSFIKREKNLQPSNHGALWTPQQEHKLKSLFEMGRDLEGLCEAMGRTTDSLTCRLGKMGLITYDNTTNKYHYAHIINAHRLTQPTPVSATQTQPTKEIIMSAANIETKTFIGGVEASQLSDAQIFNQIHKLEVEVGRWEGIQNRPKKLDKLIAGIQKDIADLVKYVDGRK